MTTPIFMLAILSIALQLFTPSAMAKSVLIFPTAGDVRIYIECLATDRSNVRVTIERTFADRGEIETVELVKYKSAGGVSTELLRETLTIEAEGQSSIDVYRSNTMGLLVQWQDLRNTVEGRANFSFSPATSFRPITLKCHPYLFN